jgi:hypothetical protein
MPVCQWCGIDSKNDVVCDWCKRPLGLKRAGNATVGGKSAIDLLADNSDDNQAILPQVLAAGAVVCIAVVATVLYAISTNGKAPPAPVANVNPPSPAHENFVAEKQPISPVQASYTPPPPRVFLPQDPDINLHYRLTAGAGSMPAPRASVQLDHQKDEVKFGLSAVKLTAFKQPNGKMMAIGKISVFNGSPDNIIDYNLTLISGGHKYKLVAFSGTFEQRELLSDHVVLSKEKAAIPVFADDFKGKAGPITGTVRLVASLDSSEKPVSSEFKISGSKH